MFGCGRITLAGKVKHRYKEICWEHTVSGVGHLDSVLNSSAGQQEGCARLRVCVLRVGSERSLRRAGQRFESGEGEGRGKCVVSSLSVGDFML